MYKKIFFILIFILCLYGFSFAQTEEKLTITTYYPSPHGSYKKLSTTSDTRLATDDGTNVGIGTTSPASLVKLHVEQTQGTKIYFCGGSPTPCIYFGNQDACIKQEGCIWTVTQDASWCEGVPAPCISFGDENLCSGQNGCSWDYLIDSYSAIFMGGKVGIGTESPEYMLHVTGGCGGAISCDEDIAEVFQKIKDEKLEPGDVVVLSGTDRFNLYKSQKPYDTNVAGVYSTDPGMLIRGKEGLALSMGSQKESEFSDTQMPLALVGKTIVKVTNENGPIKKGDLLTTSSTPGHAMKCPVETDEQKLKCMGAILGKALESCDEPICKITALISLQ